MFGMKSIMGLAGTNVFTGILLVAICIACGLLVHLPFISALSHAIEKWLSKYVPGYDTYRVMAEEKLQNKVRLLPYTAALIRQRDFWKPAFVIEQDSHGNCVVFLPEVPETNKGHVLLAKQDQLRFVSSVTAIQLDASLKQIGKGLLTEHGIQSAMN
jgi:hypothetical protein